MRGSVRSPRRDVRVTTSTSRFGPPLELSSAGIEGVREAGVKGAFRLEQAAVEFGCEAGALLQHQVQPLERVDVSVPVPLVDEVLLYPRLPRVEPGVGGDPCDVPGDLAVRGGGGTGSGLAARAPGPGRAVKGAATAGCRCPGFRRGGAGGPRSGARGR